MSEKMTFVEYKTEWLLRHPGSIPTPKEAEKHGILAKLAWGFSFISSAIVSGVHTVPTIVQTIPSSEYLTSDAKWIASLFGFGAIELSIFLSARYRADSNVAKAGLFLSVAAAIVSNVYSGLHILQAANDNFIGGAAAILLGIIIPLLAVVSGEQWSKLDREDKIAQQLVDIENDGLDKELDKIINAAYHRYLNPKERRGNRAPTPMPSEDKQNKADALAQRIIDDGYYNKTISELEVIYNAPRGTVQRAKAKVKELGY